MASIYAAAEVRIARDLSRPLTGPGVSVRWSDGEAIVAMLVDRVPE